MPRHPLSDNDRRLLGLARWLVKRVVDNHPHEIAGPVMVHVAAAIHGIELVEKDLELLAE